MSTRLFTTVMKTIQATLAVTGSIMRLPSLGREGRTALRQRRALGHDRRGTGDRVRQVEIGHRRHERRPVRRAAARGQCLDRGRIGGLDPIERCRQGCADEAPREAGQRVRTAGACRVRRTARAGSPSPRAHHPARSRRGWRSGLFLGVHIGGRFLGVGRARQDDICTMRAAVADRRCW